MKAISVLGIETSCDETAAAVVVRDGDGVAKIKSNIVLSQTADHAPYGGVVPEIAARAHVLHLDRLIRKALDDAEMDFADVDGFAATAGPGLLGGVLVGLVTAKALAMAHDKPLLAVNHLEGHALTVGLTDNIKPPYLLLLISGGHTQLLAVSKVGVYHRYGTTIDDALGEAFDKTAKLLQLGFPGGPQVEKAARQGDGKRFDLPRPLKGRVGCDFSFSGLKTAVRQLAEKIQPISDNDIADICASFETAIADTLADRIENAMQRFNDEFSQLASKQFVVAGGVAANKTLRTAIQQTCQKNGFTFIAPPPALCTDNAAMIAWAGLEKLARGESDPLDYAARARWPLSSDAPAAPFAGVKA